jgi:hypothetical protein
MRFDPNQPQLYCGIDLHARTMSVCLLHQGGAMRVHRPIPAGPAPFLKVMAPYRQGLVVGVACICTWSGRADLCARAGLPCVLGPALSMQARHGGQAHPISARPCGRAATCCDAAGISCANGRRG